MFIEILIFLLLGIVVGILTGLIPGVHPNTIVLFIPVLLTLSFDPINIMVFIVAMAVSNVIADFIPSLIFGAAESEYSLGIHPAQRMLHQGRGLEAIKLSLMGALGAFLFLLALLPLVFFAVPGAYEFSRPFIHYILILIVAIMLYDEKRRLVSLGCFLASGVVGILAFQMPLNSTILLFPILVGFFGIPAILMKIKYREEIPEQNTEVKDSIPFLMKIKSIVAGTFGGVASGFLPGVGTSEIAGISTINKNEKSFLVTLGAIAIVNIVLSFIAIFLIDRARSGVAVAANEVIQIGFNEVLVIFSVGLISLVISIYVVLSLSKKVLENINKINYILINKIVLVVLVILIYIFSGVYGMFLAGLCTTLGIIVMLNNVKRGLLMGVLILPTILFFAGL